MPREPISAPLGVNVPGFAMAGFQVTLYGRIWVTPEAPVKEIMTSPVIFATPDQAVDECMIIMTRNRIRHLPIMENEKVLGVVSIGDLVKWIVSEQEETIKQLHNYISAKYPA
jgi:CBS domain-containing protein